MVSTLLRLALALVASVEGAPASRATSACPEVKVECSDRFSSKTCGQFQTTIDNAFQEAFAKRHGDTGIETRGCDLFPGVKQIIARASPARLSLSVPLTPSVVAAFQLKTLSFKFFLDAWRVSKVPTPIYDYSMLATQFGAAIVRAGVYEWMNTPINLTIGMGDNWVVLGAADAADQTQLILAAKSGARQALNSDDSFEEVFKKAIAPVPARRGSK